MGISRDLASQFAKITNDSNKQTEETMYGTVVSQGGKLYVNLDGSDTITPIVTTAEIKPGERVAVMIKGHTATVIGNISNPGASTETTGKILDEYDVIVAKIGDFELIVADKITTEQLEAELAIIDELIAKKATIDELEAVKASIKDLDVSELWAELAEIEKAVIGKAEIEDLEATHAKIDILEADLADIETLVGGQLTMDNIQSLVLTSSKVTVDNAFIKDAMIDRVSASKLAAGTINTNLIQIGSEDGSLAINGSLQQFKDADGNVRIQIGKDSTGDFTFALYGEDGKGQLINQNGITASAIGDGLIVNDMVADNAHISGDKLDISSVITEINGSTTTIDSSRIYLDQENKSLSVAFNNLKDTVETIKEVNIEGDFTAALNKIESLTTELNVAKDNINTLVSNTTIVTQNGETIQMKDDYTTTKQTVNSISQKVGSLETTTKDITSKQTEFEQSLDGFELEVSTNYATKNELDNIQIGGRNLLQNSTGNLGNMSKWIASNGAVISFSSSIKKGSNNTLCLQRTDFTGTSRCMMTQNIPIDLIEEGDNFCISGWYYIDSSTPLDKITANDIRLRIYRNNSDSVYSDIMIAAIDASKATNTWHKFESKGVTPAGYGKKQNHFMCALEGNGCIRFAELKLEKGTKVTDWTPALEDNDTRFTGYYTKSETDSKINVLNNSISMKVGQTELKETVDAIQIGTTNMLRHTNFEREDILNYWTCTANNTVSTLEYTDSMGGQNLPGDAHLKGKRYLVFSVDIAKAIANGTEYGRCNLKTLTDFKLEPNTTYTFSYWTYKARNCAYSYAAVWEAKSDGSSTVEVARTPNLTTYTGSFVPQSVTFTTGDGVNASHHYIAFYNYFNTSLTTGTSDMRIFMPLLTKGSRVVDWTESPLDVEYYDSENMTQLQKNLNQNIEAAVNKGESNVLTTIQGLYAKKDTFETFRSSVSSQFEQTATNINMQFSNAVAATDTVNGKLEEYKAKVDSYIRFSTNGMEMGKNDSPFKTTLTNQKLSFTENGYEVAYMSDNKLYITNAEILDIFIMGSWIWDVSPNGNLSLNWRG